MSRPIIEVDCLSKRYRLGQYNAHTLREELEHVFRRLRTNGRRGDPSDEADLWALRDVSFDVQPGEVLGIIGRNGAGKSTLLKILSRITEPTSGEIRIRGRVASLLEIGAGFHPELTGLENIYLNGTILGMSKAEIRDRFDEIVAFAEIPRFIDTPVKRYSSGMYVRLAFAIAAHLEPEVLIVDEVLAVGDQAFQQKCLGKMRDSSARQGRTVLFVTHDMTAIERLCSRAIVMSHGHITYDGSVGGAVGTYLEVDHQDSRAGTVALDAHPRRAAGLEPIMRLIRIGDARLESSVLRCMQKATIEIDVRPSHPLTDAVVGVGVDDLTGRRLITFNTDIQCSSAYDGRIATGTIRCEIPVVPVAPGEYFLTVGISRRGQYLDFIDQAAKIRVANSDGWPGAFPTRSQSPILCHATFQFEEHVPS